MINLGFHDGFRHINSDKEGYTFWDYMAGAWQKNHGMRIDHFLVSNNLLTNIKNINIGDYVAIKRAYNTRDLPFNSNGQSFGVIKGICSALSLPIYFVRPTKWKKHFNLIKTNKDASRTKVIEVIPKYLANFHEKKTQIKLMQF